MLAQPPWRDALPSAGLGATIVRLRQAPKTPAERRSKRHLTRSLRSGDRLLAAIGPASPRALLDTRASRLEAAAARRGYVAGATNTTVYRREPVEAEHDPKRHDLAALDGLASAAASLVRVAAAVTSSSARGKHVQYSPYPSRVSRASHVSFVSTITSPGASSTP